MLSPSQRGSGGSGVGVGGSRARNNKGAFAGSISRYTEVMLKERHRVLQRQEGGAEEESEQGEKYQWKMGASEVEIQIL